MEEEGEEVRVMEICREGGSRWGKGLAPPELRQARAPRGAVPERMFWSPGNTGSAHLQESFQMWKGSSGEAGKVQGGWGEGKGGRGAVLVCFPPVENLTLNLERPQSPHPLGLAHGGRQADPPSRASTSSVGSGTTL